MTSKQAESLAKALKKTFGGKVELETVNGHGRYRFAVTSRRFEEMRQLERQDLVWRVVDQVLPRESTLDVSMILAFAPTDLVHSR